MHTKVNVNELTSCITRIFNKDVHSVLNWDHEVTPTPMDDLIENIRTRVCDFTGREKLSVEIADGVLKIHGINKKTVHHKYDLMMLPPETHTWEENLLTLSLKGFTPREHNGRAAYCGLDQWEIHTAYNALSA